MRPAARTFGPTISPGPCSESHLRKSKPSPADCAIEERDVAAVGGAEDDLAGAGADRGDRRVVVEPRAPRVVAQLGDLLAVCRGATIPSRRPLVFPLVQSRVSS